MPYQNAAEIKIIFKDIITMYRGLVWKCMCSGYFFKFQISVEMCKGKEGKVKVNSRKHPFPSRGKRDIVLLLFDIYIREETSRAKHNGWNCAKEEHSLCLEMLSAQPWVKSAFKGRKWVRSEDSTGWWVPSHLWAWTMALHRKYWGNVSEISESVTRFGVNSYECMYPEQTD